MHLKEFNMMAILIYSTCKNKEWLLNIQYWPININIKKWKNKNKKSTEEEPIWYGYIVHY